MAIENNQTVSIEYELTLEGNVIDGNAGQEPLTYTAGTQQIIPGLESRIAHLNVGESATVIVPAAEAYGEYSEDATQVIPRSDLAGVEEELVVGMRLNGSGPDGEAIEVAVKEVGETEVTIDFNHPLAGEDLTFAVKILSIQ